MRFQIGQKIPVISFIVRGQRADGVSNYSRSTTHFLPWDETVVSSQIVYLTVKEHHKVPNAFDQSNELTCDGYILETSDGERWFNQFPRASYGQLDDSADRQFHRENLKDYKYRHYIALFSYLENLLRGEAQLIANNPAYASMLRVHYEELKSRYEEMTGYVIVYEPFAYKNGDGTKSVLPEWFTITTDVPEVIARHLYDAYFCSVSPIPLFDESRKGLIAYVEAHTRNEHVLKHALHLIDTLFDRELVEDARQ